MNIQRQYQQRICEVTGLGHRELQVIKLVIEGHKNKEIALALQIHQKNVSTYKRTVKKKLKIPLSSNDHIFVVSCATYLYNTVKGADPFKLYRGYGINLDPLRKFVRK